MNALVKVVAPIIVVLASLGSLFMVTKVAKTKKDQAASIQELTGTLATTKSSLDAKSAKLKETEGTLLTTQNNLAKTDGELTAAKGEIEQKTKTLGELQTQITAKDTELTETKKTLATTQEEAKNLQEKVAKFEAAPPPDTEKLKAAIKDLEGKVAGLSQENSAFATQLTALQADKAKLLAEKEDWTTTPVTVRGMVTTVQDKWGFVVLNVGEKNHVRKDAKFLVYRDSKLVCKLQVVSVTPDSSIAEVMADYQRGEPRVGDSVLR
jgi:myosin heavy subunit